MKSFLSSETGFEPQSNNYNFLIPGKTLLILSQSQETADLGNATIGNVTVVGTFLKISLNRGFSNGKVESPATLEV